MTRDECHVSREKCTLVIMNNTTTSYNREKGPLERDSISLSRMVWTLCRQLSPRVSFERPVLSQFLRAGTSVGANICEAQYAESKKDFVHKLKIAEKELAELTYWLDIISTDPALVTKDDLGFIVDKLVNVRRMLASAIRTAKER